MAEHRWSRHGAPTRSSSEASGSAHFYAEVAGHINIDKRMNGRIKRAQITTRKSRIPKIRVGEAIGSVQLGGDVHAVVLACDQGYAMPLATTLRSMAESNRSGRLIHVVLLISQFSESLRERVARSVPDNVLSLTWVSVDLEAVQSFATRNYISKITYARLFLPEIFDKSMSRVLYLDADILVLDDVNQLWAIDLKNCALGAVGDSDADGHSKRLWPGHDSDLEQIPAYFNAGVLLVDLQRWRDHDISTRAFRYMLDYPDTPLADQDALNVACCGAWTRLDPRWNRQEYDVNTAASTSLDTCDGIVHFAGKWKPWNPLSLSSAAGFYDSFRRRTRFARTHADRAKDMARCSWKRLRQMARRYRPLVSVYEHMKRYRRSQVR